MRPWIKRSLIALFGAAVLAGGLSACGHHEHGPGMAQMSAEDAAKWREKLIERAGKELQLDATQKQQLGVLFDRLREQRNALVDEKTGAVRSKSPEVIAAAGDFYDGLKPEQQAKLRDWLQSRGHGPFSSWRS